MPKKIRINKQISPGRPKDPLNMANLPEKMGAVMPKQSEYSSLPKKIVGSHMGYMQTGGDETPPKIKGPEIGRPPKQPPRIKKAPIT